MSGLRRDLCQTAVLFAPVDLNANYKEEKARLSPENHTWRHVDIDLGLLFVCC